MKTFGERVRELREELDLSLREFARKLEKSAAFISDVELGRRFPSEELLVEMARTLRVSAEELRKYDERPPVDEIRRRAALDPEYGFLMRSVAGLSPGKLKELREFLEEQERDGGS